MAFTFYHTQMPAGVGGAILGAAQRKANFARRVELARLQIERQRMDLDQARHLSEVSDLEWRRRAAQEAAEEERRQQAGQMALEQAKLGVDAAREQRLGLDLQDRLQGGEEQRRIDSALALEARKRELTAPDRAVDQAATMLKLGFAPADAKAPAQGQRLTLPDGTVWEERAAGKDGGTYSAWAKMRLANLKEDNRLLRQDLDLTDREAAKLREKLRGIVLDGDYGRSLKAQVEQQLAALPSSAGLRQRIAANDAEISRLTDSAMPAEERAALEAKGTARQQAALRLAEALGKVPWTDAKDGAAAAWVTQALRSGTPAEKRKAFEVLMKLAPRAGLGLETAGVRDVEF